MRINNDFRRRYLKPPYSGYDSERVNIGLSSICAIILRNAYFLSVFLSQTVYSPAVLIKKLISLVNQIM